MVDKLSWNAAEKRINLTLTSRIDQTIELQCRLPISNITGGTAKEEGRWMLHLAKEQPVSLKIKLK